MSTSVLVVNSKKTGKETASTTSVSSRRKMQEKTRQALRIRRTYTKWEEKKAAREKAWEEMQTYFYTNKDDSDYLADASRSDEATKQNSDLQAAYRAAENEEKIARQEYWSAKYDSMTDKELQDTIANINDEEEKTYVTSLQGKRVQDKRKKDLEIMSAIGDPESVLYHPDFEAKSEYRSTKLTDGSLGESDTGYADIDYEFINGNEDISELIVGMNRNYYYITDQERRVYNFWHNYDRENGTDVAQNYLDLLQETLNDRASQVEYAKIEGKALHETLYGIKSGLSKFGNDVNNWILKPEGYIPMTSTEMTARRAHQGLEDVGGSLKINGESIGQHLFNFTEDVGYNLPKTIPNVLYGNYAGAATAVLDGFLTGVSTDGAAYREMINQGYTPEQAREYGNSVGFGTGVVETASNLLKKQVKERLKTTVFDSPVSALGNILSDSDWLGLTDVVQAEIKGRAFGEVTGKGQDKEKLQKATLSEVTAKAMDKIFNRMGADPENISADLRKPILQSLQDPAIRKLIEQKGRFSPEQLDKITAGLINAGDRDEGIGTYVGDILYGPTGFAINKWELIPLAEEAFRNRGLYADHPNARALYLRYKR